MSIIHTIIDIASTLPMNDYDVPAEAPPGSDGFLRLLGAAKWISTWVAVIALIIFGGFIGFKMSRGNGEVELGKFGVILIGAIIISGAASLIGWIQG